MRFIWLQAIAILLGLGCATARAETYDFRGIALGTSLDDVRRVRFPEAASARIICRHDAAASDLRPTNDFVTFGEEARAGVRICGPFTFGKVLGPSSSLLPAEWIAARLKVGDIDVKPTFWFVNRASAEQGTAATGDRLYKIALRTNAQFWDEVLATLIRRYGKPVSSERGSFNGYRGQLDNQTVTWTNAQSTIKLIKRFEVPQRMLILYQHNALTPGADAPS